MNDGIIISTHAVRSNNLAPENRYWVRIHAMAPATSNATAVVPAAKASELMNAFRHNGRVKTSPRIERLDKSNFARSNPGQTIWNKTANNGKRTSKTNIANTIVLIRLSLFLNGLLGRIVGKPCFDVCFVLGTENNIGNG